MEKEKATEILSSIVDGVISGSPPSKEIVSEITTFLTNMQSKLDLGQVGLVHYHLKRIQKVADLIEKIENKIVDQTGDVMLDLTTTDGRSEALEWLKQLQKSMVVSMEYVDGKATKPAISSPESMKTAAASESPTHIIQSARYIPPEKRQKIRDVIAIVQSAQKSRSEVKLTDNVAGLLNKARIQRRVDQAMAEGIDDTEDDIIEDEGIIEAESENVSNATGVDDSNSDFSI